MNVQTERVADCTRHPFVMVSYSRARAEGLGVTLKEGLMQRPQRLALLILASIFSPVGLLLSKTGDESILSATLALIAGLTAWTAFHRFFGGLRELAQGERP